VIGRDVSPPLGDASPLQLSPLLPMTVQLCASDTFQCTCVGSPDCKRFGINWSCPLKMFEPNVEELKKIAGARHDEELFEQYCGVPQIVMFCVEQSALVCTIVLPWHDHETGQLVDLVTVMVVEAYGSQVGKNSLAAIA